MNAPERIALVTGANKGIGFEISRQLGEAGLFVIMGARDPEKGLGAVSELAAQGLKVAFVRIDLADELAIAEAAAEIEATYGVLDILVNNAGIVDPEDGPPTASSTGALRRIMETNFIGTFAVTRAMLPLLKKSSAGRIVNLSSALGSLAVNGDPSSPFYEARLIGYNASKAAVNMLTIQLDAELKGTSIAVNSVSPGYVKTGLTGFSGIMTPEEGAATPVKFALFGDGTVSGGFEGPDGPTPW